MDHVSQILNKFWKKNFPVKNHCPEIFPDFSGQIEFADGSFQEISWMQNVSCNWRIGAKID